MHTSWISPLTRKTNCLLTQQPGEVYRTMNREFEATLIRCALAVAGGCRKDAARLLGIGRSTLARKMDAFGLDGTDASSRHR